MRGAFQNKFGPVNSVKLHATECSSERFIVPLKILSHISDTTPKVKADTYL